MKDGLVIESNAEYHGYKEAISKSRLANMSKSPAYFRWIEDNPQPPTEDLIFGSAFHKIVLEPDDFENEFAVMPNVDRRTKAGKLEYEEFVANVAEKNLTVITQEVYDTICQMRDAVNANKYAKRLLEGNHEQSMYFTDELTGVQCKCRPDCWSKTGDTVIITDLKSCRSAYVKDFSRDIIQYHYDLQDYMYCTGVSKVLNVPLDKIKFAFIAVEKKEPYLINVMVCENVVYERGEACFRDYVGMYAECLKTGNWYGLNGSEGIPNSLTLPDYMLLKKENE